MRPSSAATLAGLSFAAGATLLIFIFTHKSPAPPAPITPEGEDRLSKYIIEVQQKNELERDELERERKLAKEVKAKKDSPECQFWMLQKAKSSASNHKAEEKISQFCEPEGTITSL